MNDWISLEDSSPKKDTKNWYRYEVWHLGSLIGYGERIGVFDGKSFNHEWDYERVFEQVYAWRPIDTKP